MLIYDIIYDYLIDNIFASTTLDAYELTIMGVNTTMNQWLAHTVSIIAIILMVVWLIVVLRWIFHVCWIFHFGYLYLIFFFFDFLIF